jgi:hypothetical protein
LIKAGKKYGSAAEAFEAEIEVTLLAILARYLLCRCGDFLWH